MISRVLTALAFGAGLSVAGGALADSHVAAGEKLVAKRCKACHMISDGDNVILKGGAVGPNLYGLIGRPAAGLSDYKGYGKSLVAAGEAGLVWTAEELDAYLADPKKYLRAKLDDKKAKSKMAFKLKKEKDRAAAVAYFVSLAEGS